MLTKRLKDGQPFSKNWHCIILSCQPFLSSTNLTFLYFCVTFLETKFSLFFGQPNSRQTLKSNNSLHADWINIPAVASSRCVWCQHQSDLSWFQLLHGGSVFVIGSLSRLYLVCLSADEYECHSVQTHWRRLFRADWLVARFEIIHLAVFFKKKISVRQCTWVVVPDWIV